MIVIAVGVCILMGVGWALWDIQKSVKHYCQIAQQAHPEQSDDVAALMAYIDSNTHSLKEKNHVVWTLGRIGDPRALEVLRPHYTGGKCKHDERLCQGELKKAIARCDQ